MLLRTWIAVVITALAPTPALAQQGTAFTFQGRLEASGAPANGAFDMTFGLWDSPVGGQNFGNTLTKTDVPVVNGLFSVQLDFLALPLHYERWLEVAVDGVTLSPRQLITGAPYAVQTRGMYVNNNTDFVGVGRVNRIGNESFGIFHATTNNYGGMYVQTNGPAGLPFYGYSADGSTDMWTYYDGATDSWHVHNNGNRLTVESSGDVGIGTETPIAKLQVTGNGGGTVIRATNGGPGGTAIIAGDVTGNGRAASFYGISSDTLFSCVNDGAGDAAGFGGNVAINNGNLNVDGDYYGLGHIWLHAYEGDGQDGTAYIQARDNSGASTIDLVLRTQLLGEYRDVMRFDGLSASLGGPDPNGLKAKLYIAGTDSVFPIPTLRIDRLFMDGALIDFRSLGASRGSISVSGNTVSYNAFTGSHYTYPDGCGPIERGALVRMTGNNLTITDEPNAEVIYGIAPTTSANDSACLGAYLTAKSEAAGPEAEPHLVMAVGNGDMWVADSGAGDIQPGDELISSHVTGCAMKDDPERFAVGHVIARAAQRVEWDTITPDTDGVRRARISVLFTPYTRQGQNEARIQELHDRIARLEALLETRPTTDD